jgi:transcriptional regulator with XRE-family HTH domain
MTDKKTERKLDNARTNMKIAVALSDLSASEISQRAGLSINVLGKYLRGETMISFGNMQAVCDVLDVPLALITTERQITPARVRLSKILLRMSDHELQSFIDSEAARKIDTQ